MDDIVNHNKKRIEAAAVLKAMLNEARESLSGNAEDTVALLVSTLTGVQMYSVKECVSARNEALAHVNSCTGVAAAMIAAAMRQITF